MAEEGQTPVRPLSPHIQVYRWQWTMALSILHRATGLALIAGTLLFAWWIIAAAVGPDAFEAAQGFIGSIFGQLLLFGWTVAFFYHFCNGIRHLLWDSGRLLELKPAYESGIWVLGGTAVLTVIAWIIGIAAA